MSQIDVNIIEPIPYIQIMQGVGPKGEKGDKGDPGEVSQATFDALSAREQEHYDELSGALLNKASSEDVAKIKSTTNSLLEATFDIKSFAISIDGSEYSDKILVRNGSSLGVIYTKGEFSFPPSEVTQGSPGEIELTFGTTTVTNPLTAPSMSTTFMQRYVAPNVIRNDVTATITTYFFEVPYDHMKQAYVKFVDTIHYGVASAGSLTDSFLLNGLSGHVLSETREATFTVSAGTNDYIWVALPVSYGKPMFTVGGFVGGFVSQGTFNHTNNNGYSTSYEVWRSTNRGLGDVTVTIT